MKMLAVILAILLAPIASAQSARYPVIGSGTVTTVTGTAPIVSSGGTTPAISIPAATLTANGYLASADWVAFNGKQPLLSAASTTVNGYLASGDWVAFNGGGRVKATATVNGYLASADWATFNGKQALLTTGSTVPGHFFEIYPDDSASHHVELTMAPGGSVSYQIFWPNYAPSPGSSFVVDGSGFFQWASSSSSWLTPVKCVATNADAFLFTLYSTTCDNFYNPVVGDRFLVASFAGGAQPELTGIYVVNDLAEYERASDANTATVLNGVAVQIRPLQGYSGDGTIWVQTANIATVDTTAQTWVQVGAVTATAPVVSSGGIAPVISIPVATLTANGYLASADWKAFNGGGRVKATATVNGYLASADWATFNGKQVSVGAGAGSCSVSSSTPSTTPANLTCTGVPASAAVAVNCSGGAAFSTAVADALYCRATGTADQIACNTAVANVTAMTLACSWVKP